MTQNTARSKIDQGDAQEMLSALQLTGEGWYRQCALGVKLGAPEALGMTDREFARAIGQRLVDSRQAIVELFDEGHSQARIAAVLSVSRNTVHDVLIDAGRIEGEKSGPKLGEHTRRKALGGSAGATSEGEGGSAGATSEDKERADKLAHDLKQAEAKVAALAKAEAAAKAEVAEYRQSKKDIAKLVAAKVEAARKEAKDELTDQERERLRKEGEAWAHEQAQSILNGFRKQTVEHTVSAITEATNNLDELVKDGEGIDSEDMDRISSALAALNEQAAVARSSVTMKGQR